MNAAEDEDVVASSSRDADKVLDTLVEVGSISADAAADARAQFAALRDALLAAGTQEKALAQQAKQLARERDASELAAAEAQRKAAAFEGVSIEVLREDVETALAEATLAQERAALMALEQQELQRQRDQLAEHLDSVAVQHAAALAPVAAGLQEDLAGLRRELEQQRLAAAVAAQELAGVTGRLHEAEPALAALHQESKAEQGRLTSVAAAPEKARRQADLATAELAAAQQLLAAAESKQAEAEAAVRAVHEREHQRQMEYAAALGGLERARIMADAKERHGDDVIRDLELAGLEREKILGDHASMALTLQALCRELRMQQEALSRARHENLLALRAHKAAEEALAEARESLPPLRIAKELTAKDKATAQAELAATQAEVAELRHQVDARIAAFLKEEGIGKDKAALFSVLQQEVRLLEQESAGLREDDRQMSRLLADMAAQRDRVARHVALRQSKVVAAESTAKLRAWQEAELRSMVAEQERRGRDFDELYDLVRHQRNKFVALISQARQAAVEMGDRMRLLSSEQEVVAADVASKAQLLGKARAVRVGSIKERDALFNELHALGGTFRQKGEKLQEQSEAIQGLSAHINRAKCAMAMTKKSYEAAVEARNNTGLMLVDRSDELSALHEKAHQQEAHITRGTLALSTKEDEIRVLKLQVSELERSLHTSKAALPDLPAIDRDIAALKAGLLKARKQSCQLSDRLEDTSNTSRIRVLGGRIPEKEELVAKLQSLEERLGMQQDGLAEKAVVLDEVTSLTSQLRQQAAASRPLGAELSATANAHQERLRGVTRRLMATISELSLYQATALKLHATKCELERVVQQAAVRLDEGLPPTAEAEMEWSAACWQAQTLHELKQQREQEAAILDAKGALLTTAAEPRPNAYIPQALGIPKPYGAFAPFKPTAPGATMRNTRPPAPREVVL